jgi:hypothetical protein
MLKVIKCSPLSEKSFGRRWNWVEVKFIDGTLNDTFTNSFPKPIPESRINHRPIYVNTEIFLNSIGVNET